MSPRSLLPFALAGLLLTPGPAAACNVPVFRYALDHWAADPYRLTLFHRGPLDPAAVRDFRKHAEAEFPKLALHLVDLEKTPDAERGVPTGAALPWLVVQYPTATKIEAPVWAGPLAELPAATLLDSPARSEIARRVRGGDSAVWVLLAGGDDARDAAAEKTLRTELKRLEAELKLPKLTAAPEDRVVDEAGRPLRLAFSVLRVSRTAADEQVLVRMLLNTEDDLPGRADPLVFPVFGRGRVLPALVGPGITPDNLGESAAFLVGPCSCQVKRENPGVDLLITADWGAAVTAPPEPVGPAVTGGTSVPIPVAAEPVAAPAERPSAAPRVWPRYAVYGGIGVAAVVVLVTGTLLLLGRRAGPPHR